MMIGGMNCVRKPPVMIRVEFQASKTTLTCHQPIATERSGDWWFLTGGKIERFGKHNIRFIKEYRKFTVICVGQAIGTKVKIFTIETKGEKI